MRVKDRVVVITGASSGIGRATALRFAAKGARLVLAARGAENLEATARECRKRGAKAIAVPTDVTDAGQVEALALRAEQEFGRVDVWVNNAAVGVFGRVAEVPLEDFQRVLDVNISGYVNGARAALPRMCAQGSGVLINIASLMGEIALPYSAAYSMSKAAVRALSVSLRLELKLDGISGVHVSTVLPATIDTPFFQHAANYTGRRVSAMPPVYTPERAARIIVNLARRPRREAGVGPATPVLVLQHKLAPRMVENVLAGVVDNVLLPRRHSAADTSGNLHEISDRTGTASITGGWHGRRGTAQRRIASVVALAGAAAIIRRRHS